MDLVHSKKNQAFSLVELAMVVAIIGLLVAAVAASYKLIDGAKIRAVASEVQQINTAFKTFQNKYDAVPGDMVDASSYFVGHDCGISSESGGTQAARCNGNGDLKISGGSPSGEKCGEWHNVWNHFYYADIFKVVTPSCSALYESNKYEALHYMIFNADLSNNPGFYNDPDLNVIQLGKTRSNLVTSNPYTNYNNAGKIFPPNDAKNLDLKLDDGVAYSGRFQSYNGYDDSNNQDGSCSFASMNASNSTDYQLSNAGAECISYFLVDTIL